MAVLICAAAVAMAAAVAWRRARRRDRRLARAAHELRGSAAALSLALDTVRRQPGGRRLALVFDSEFARLRCGLEDLDAARERRRPRLTARAEPLERAVRSAALGWRSAVAGSGRRVDLRWEAGEAPVVADRGRLAQALGNLVGNAVEHGEGAVVVRGRREGRAVRVEISDRGRWAGPPRGADRGHGLDITRRAVAEAGGRLEVSGGDRGTVAAIELPVAES